MPIGSGQGTRVEEVVNGGIVDFGLCDTCQAPGEHAARLLDANPRVARGIGSPARHQVTCALNALQVIDASRPEPTTAEALSELIEQAPLGAAARWSARFSPWRRRGSREEQAASEPWLFRRYRASHRHPPRLRPLACPPPAPRPVASPSGACLLCGVGEVLTRHGDEPWRETTMNASVLGGGGGSVTGHLCPSCQTALDDSGSHMLDAAILAVVDPDRAIRRKRPYAPTVNGARGWAVRGRKPNRKPFGHLNLDTLRASLLSGDW